MCIATTSIQLLQNPPIMRWYNN